MAGRQYPENAEMQTYKTPSGIIIATVQLECEIRFTNCPFDSAFTMKIEESHPEEMGMYVKHTANITLGQKHIDSSIVTLIQINGKIALYVPADIGTEQYMLTAQAE